MSLSLTPENEALQWWSDRASRQAYVGGRKELPSTNATAVLQQRDLIVHTTGRWGFVLVVPGKEEGRNALLANYWDLVHVALKDYAPSCLTRLSAVRAHLGDMAAQEYLQVAHAANKSKRDLEIVPGHVLRLIPEQSGSFRSTELVVGRNNIEVMSDADLLFSLTLDDFVAGRQDISLWLRGVTLSDETLEEAYVRQNRPTLGQRVAHLARTLGNDTLAESITKVISAHVRKPSWPGRTGGENFAPPEVVNLPRTNHAWLDRYVLNFKRASETLEGALRAEEDSIVRLTKEEAREWTKTAKKDDTYHSTSIEGYKITPEDVEAVISGRPIEGKTPEQVERILALKGYSRAFKLVETKSQNTFQGKLVLEQGDIKDIFQELWTPCAEAGLIQYGSLREWRNHPVFIRNSRHIPPQQVKIPALMDALVEQVNATNGVMAKAALAHWGLVHIHPFHDGNGRTARLLMNLILVQQGFPWATIKVDEVKQYFGALEKTHVDNDALGLAAFLATVVKRAGVDEQIARAERLSGFKPSKSPRRR